GLDSESRLCLGCHDGSVASAAPVAERSMGSRHRTLPTDLFRAHPIGMEYSSGAWRPGTTRLRPRHALPPQVRLPDGKVGCGSCHSLYAGERFMLSLPTTRGRLCLSCHRK
ncbi:MAG: cytochrome c3 family protein, partial [Planctomycetota bacterium]